MLRRHSRLIHSEPDARVRLVHERPPVVDAKVSIIRLTYRCDAELNYWLPPIAWAAVILIGSTDRFLEDPNTSGCVATDRSLGSFGHAPRRPRPRHDAELFIRKTAHLTEYGILAALTFRAVHEAKSDSWSPRWADRRNRDRDVCIATIDEVHLHSFTPREPAPWHDVLLDTSGRERSPNPLPRCGMDAIQREILRPIGTSCRSRSRSRSSPSPLPHDAALVAQSNRSSRRSTRSTRCITRWKGLRARSRSTSATRARSAGAALDRRHDDGDGRCETAPRRSSPS